MSDQHSQASIGGYHSTHRNPMPHGGEGELYPEGTLGHKAILCLPLRTDAVDVGPNGFAVTNHGAVTFDATDGASLDGATQWLEIATDLLLSPTGPFSLAASAAWFDNPALSGPFIAKVGGDYTAGYDLVAVGGGAIELDIFDPADSNLNTADSSVQVGGVFVPTPGTRYAVFAVYDPVGDEQLIYIDGDLRAKWSLGHSRDLLPPVYSALYGLVIGDYSDHDPGNSGLPLKGTIRDVLILDRLGRPPDAVAHYNGGSGHANGGLAIVV